MSAEKKHPKSFSIGRIYLNAVTTVLSVILVLLLLQDHVQFLLYYLIFTIIIVAIIFTLRMRLPSFKMSEPIQENFFEPKKLTERLKAPLLMLLMSIALLVLPLLLARVLDPYIWFILIVGFTTGFSVAEILFYLYTQLAPPKKYDNVSNRVNASAC